jgi:cytochrome c5
MLIMTPSPSKLKWIAAAIAVVLVVVLVVKTLQQRMASTTNNLPVTSVEDRIKPIGTVAIAAVPRPRPTAPTIVTSASTPASGTESATPAPAAEAAPASAPSAAPASKVGETTYNGLCMGCHATGALQAPKFGDKGAWAPRIATGIESLYTSALKGKNSMPAKGGNPALSDADIKATVDYMVAAAK